MLILEPVTQFLIEFFRNNPSDTNTYYVQSKVYDSISGKLLSTINLTDNGNGYFSKLYTLPGDTSGTGRQITIISTVYTDSAYSQISTIYGAELEKYIIRHIPSQNLGGFTTQIGGMVKSMAPDYKKIEAMIRAIVEEYSHPYDDSALQSRIEELFGRMDQLDASTRDHVAKKLDEHASNTEKKLDQTSAAITDKISSLHRDTGKDADGSRRLFQAYFDAMDKRLMDIAEDPKTLKAIESFAKKHSAHFDALKAAVEKPIELRLIQNELGIDAKRKVDAPKDKDQEAAEAEQERHNIAAERLTRLIRP